jgi:hypothetical protein
MGRRRRDRNHSPRQNNLIHDSEGNEENGYLVPDPPKKAKMNSTKEPSEAHKNTLKKKSCNKLLRILRRRY